MTRKEQKQNNTKKQNPVLLVCGGIALLAVAVYIGVAVFCQSHFNFGTTVDGIAVGGKTVEEVEGLIKDEMKSYQIVIQERGGATETIAGTDIGMELHLQDGVKALKEQQSGFAWLVDLFRKPAYTLERVVSYEESLLKKAIAGLTAMKPKNQKAPVNATYSEYTGSGYELVPADYGTQLKEEAVLAAVADAVVSLQETVDLEESDCYVKPEIEDDNKKLLSLLEKMNTYVSTEIHYEFGSEDEVLDKAVIAEWLSVDEDMELIVDEEAVLAFVKELARRHNTAYSSKKLMTSYGVEVTVPSGAYGWRIDNGSERDQILADLKSGEVIEREPIYYTRANSHDGPDYGNSYVEINLTAQHLFLYIDGKLVVESDFVSGSIAKGYGTPGGAFPITYITRDAVLRGEGYATPVNYWMPFNGNIGMHDLTSRKAFGGDIYKTNGSHGCINLPYDAAKTIYENVEAGFPVLVYELPGSESEAVKQRSAATVMTYIDAIGEVTAASGKAITQARRLYDDLDASTKQYVTNYQTLLDAEFAFSVLQQQASAEAGATQ